MWLVENAKNYEFLSLLLYLPLLFSFFLLLPPQATLLPVYTTCIFRCRFTSVKKERSHTHRGRHTFMHMHVIIQRQSWQGVGAIWEKQQSYAAWYGAKCQTWVNGQVPLHWSRVHLQLQLLLLHHLPPPCSHTSLNPISPLLHRCCLFATFAQIFESYVKKRSWRILPIYMYIYHTYVCI